MSLETEAKTIEGEVVAEVKKVVAEAEKVEKAAVVKITAEEKLVLADAEIEYLKASAQIQQLTKVTEAKAKEYTENVEKFLVKYGLSKLDYVFEGVHKEFQLAAKKL
jgi:transcription termination factor NusB